MTNVTQTSVGVKNKSLEPQLSALLFGLDNDPSAGSPTETLLRLLLPLTNHFRRTLNQ